MFAKAIAFAAAFSIALALGATSVAAGGGCELFGSAATQATGTAVSVKGCAFGPTVLRAPVGATVTWTNDDRVPHAIAGGGWVAAQTPIIPGVSVSHTFEKAGVYAYMCYVHPGMAGVIVVGDTPFAGTTMAPLPVTPAPVANASPNSAPVQLPLAAGLVLGAALGAAGMAIVDRRYRVSDGALAVRRGHSVHAG